MPIASIPKDTPIVVPAGQEETYSSLDLENLRIHRRGKKFTLRAAFVAVTNSGKRHSEGASLHIPDFVSFIKDRPELKAAAKAFLQEVAKAAQEPANPVPDP
ncbi:MAG: hypothetical protein ACYTFQ_28580 [Planctomycetota bacterium]|jgi:hypothetical protein